MRNFTEEFSRDIYGGAVKGEWGLLSSEPGGKGTVKEKRYPRRWRSGAQGMEIFGCGARAR